MLLERLPLAEMSLSSWLGSGLRLGLGLGSGLALALELGLGLGLGFGSVVSGQWSVVSGQWSVVSGKGLELRLLAEPLTMKRPWSDGKATWYVIG
jgi:hypothetical protein